MTTHRLKQLIFRVLKWAVVVLVLFFIGRYLYVNASQITEVPWRFKPSLLALSALCFVLFYLVGAKGWIQIVRGFGYHLHFWAGFGVWGKSILARYVPSSALVVVGRIVMAGNLGVPKRVTLTTIFYEQLLVLISSVVTVSLAIVAWPDLSTIPYYQIFYALPVVGLLALLLLHPRVLRPLANVGLRVVRQPPIEVFLPYGQVLRLAVFYELMWIFWGLGAYFCLLAVIDFPLEGFPLVIAAMALGWMAAVAAPIFPGGLGVREGVVTVVLGLVISPALAVAVALLLRVWQTLVEVGFISLGLLMPGARPSRSQASSEAVPDPE